VISALTPAPTTPAEKLQSQWSDIVSTNNDSSLVSSTTGTEALVVVVVGGGGGEEEEEECHVSMLVQEYIGMN